MITNTPENKAKFFALYEGQDVLWHPELAPESYGYLCERMVIGEIEPSGFNETYAMLTPLSQITDEDVLIITDSFMRSRKELLDYYCLEDYKVDMERLFKNLTPQDYDYLRSKGYALPFMRIPVETLIEWGWVVLKGGDL